MRDKPNDPVFLEVRAPFAGEIVERTAVRGALVEAGKPLFTLADRSVMWAMLNIPETALARVRVGQTVELKVESLPGQTFTGKLTWIGAEVDERTRMARARAEVANPDGLLKAKMFARARILVRSAEGAVLVPSSAIYAAGRQTLHLRQARRRFVRGARGHHRREVRRTARSARRFETAGSGRREPRLRPQVAMAQFAHGRGLRGLIQPANRSPKGILPC